MTSEEEAKEMAEKIKEVLEGVFGGHVEIMSLSSGPEPQSPREWKSSSDPRVRKILELYMEVATEAARGGADPFRLGDQEAVAIMIALGAATLVINARGEHLGCLKELYMDFFKHVMGEQAVADNMIEAMKRVAGERQPRDQTDWEDVIAKMSE